MRRIDYPPEAEQVAAMVASAPMPPGYELSLTVQRPHLYRSLWNVRVLRDGERVWGRAYYSVARGIVDAQREAWAMSRGGVPLTVTTDAAGYITSIEETAGG